MKTLFPVVALVLASNVGQSAAQDPPVADEGVAEMAEPAVPPPEPEQVDPTPAPAPVLSSPTLRPLEPGEMTHREAVTYFRERREWRRHRYDRPVTLGVSSGYAWVSSSREVNPYRVGIGGTVGYTFPIHNTYLGLSFLRFNGEHLSAAGPPDQDDLRGGSYSSLRMNAEVGHEFIYRYIRLRPLLTGGATLLVAPDGKKVIPTYGLGGTLLAPFSIFYVGVDIRADFLTSSTGGAAAAATTLLTLGARL